MMGFIKTLINERLTTYVYIMMVATLFLFKPLFKSTIDNSSLILYISYFFAAVFIHFIAQKDKNWFRLDVIFLLGFGIVHFQWPIMISLSGITPKYMLYNFRLLDSDYINYGTWLSTVGILSWLLGYSWLKSPEKYIVKYRFQYKKLFWFTTIFFILFVLTAGSKYLSGGAYKGEGGGSAGKGISVYFNWLASVAILVLTVVVILNKNDKGKTKKTIFWFLKLDKKYLILSAAYILFFMSVGNRSAAIFVVSTFLVMLGSLVRPIVLKECIVIIITGAIVLTLIGLGRSVESNENILIAGSNKVEFSSNYDATMELANSARTLYYALYDVPEHHDYFLGQLWIGKMLTIIPFAQSLYLKFTDAKRYELGSASYITYLRFGLNPPMGEGTCLIADIYLNFGLIGVMFLMLLLGLFFKKIQNELRLQRSFYWLLTAALLASITFFMARGSLFDGLRAIVWGLLFALLLVKRKKTV
jgi:oligosaccharide repeat unit polymerase